MKKAMFIILCSITLFSFTSCAVLLGVDLKEKIQLLELGQSKQEVIQLLGTDYYVESAGYTPEGKLEVLHFRSYYDDYLLYFLEGELTEFHRYIPPINSEIKVVKEEKK